MVTYGVYDPALSDTAARTESQSPPERNEAVVAPLWPKFVPVEEDEREATKASPQPPSGAVVESPARMKAGGLARFVGWVLVAPAKSRAETM